MTHALPSPLPGWRITQHARARAVERGICDRDLRLTVEEPWCSYPQTDTYGADRQVRVRGDWAVVVNPATRTLITILFSSRARWPANDAAGPAPVRPRSDSLRFAPPVLSCPAVNTLLPLRGRWGAQMNPGGCALQRSRTARAPIWIQPATRSQLASALTSKSRQTVGVPAHASYGQDARAVAWASPGRNLAMTAPYALLIGIIVGAAIVLIARRNPYQAKILEHVQHLGAVFAHPAHRGDAAEFALENLLEITGLGKHRDFDLQVTLPEGGRPDVVLKFPGRGSLAIDSKFPLDHYQRALATTNDTKEHNAALREHAKALAGHVAELAKRDYPSKLPDSLGFVVLYVPSEDLLTAAYITQPRLFQDAVKRHVLLAGPVTALAIFWSITFGLQQQALSQNARQIGKSAAELHRRLGNLADPLQKLGRTMTTAVDDYGHVLGTLETRVFPEVRRLEKLGAFTPGTEVPEIPPLDAYPRPVAIERYPRTDTDSQNGQHTGGPADEDLTDDKLTAVWLPPDESALLNATYSHDENSGDG